MGEVRGRGSYRLRLLLQLDPSSSSLLTLTKTTTAPGAIVHTDGYQAYNVLVEHGYAHRRPPKQSVAPREELLPRLGLADEPITNRQIIDRAA